MKRTIIALMLIASFFGLFAIPENLVVMPKQAFMQHYAQDNLPAMQSYLGEQNFAVYYYNDEYIVAGLSSEVAKSLPAWLSLESVAIPLSQRLYLVTPNPKRREVLPASAGTLFFDLGNCLLLQSNLNEIELRQQIISHFAPLDLKPMVLRNNDVIEALISKNRTEIDDLVAQVNADSVMWFVQHLQDFQTRYALAPNRLAVATWIKNQFLRFGIQDAHVQPFQWSGTTQYNVIATIPGIVNPERYVVVGGHHDSILNQGDPLIFAPGADDNATGTVAALEMARVMQNTNFQPKNSIRFVTFAAEEFGLWGSKDYAETALQSAEEIILMINHDMIGYSNQNPSNWQVRLMPYDGSIHHSELASQITEQHTTLNPTFGNSNSASSDSHPFWIRGFPVIYFFEQVFCPYYHSENDVIANVNAAYFAEVVRASTAVAYTYGLMVSAPSNLVVQDTGAGNSLRISWQNSSDPDIIAYRVYYNTSGTDFQNPTTVNPMAGESTFYNIAALQNGTTYYIAVSSVDGDGNESYLVYGQGVPNQIPATPLAFTDEPTLNSITFSWLPNTELDLAGYHLYKSQAPNTPELVGGLITDTTYYDNDFTSNTPYYVYRLCAVDIDGNESDFTDLIQTRPVTLNNGILIVDETMDGSGSNPFLPTGADVLDFVSATLEPFWVSAIADLEISENLRLADIGIYQSIFWHGFDQSDFDAFFRNRDALRNYLELGGNIFMSSYFPSQAIEMNSGFPVTFNPNSYINSTFGIGSADYQSSARFKYANPAVDGFPLLSVDPLKTTASFNGHIFKVESIAANANATNIYYYGSDYDNSSNQGAMNDLPVAVYYNMNPGKVVCISFPLYNMNLDESRTLVQHVFGELFDSVVSASDAVQNPAADIRFSTVYPNPFPSSTSFDIETKDSITPLKLNIYNIKGQLVHSSTISAKNAKYQFNWDAKDSAGKAVANGIYFVKASQGKSIAIKKIMKIR